MRLARRRTRMALFATVSLLTTAVLGAVATPARSQLGPDVSIQASAVPNPVDVGEQITITLTVRNEGGVAATGVVVTNVLVANLEPESALSNVGSCSGAPAVVCSLGTLAPGQVATITITATAAAAGQVVNTATVIAVLDTNLSNNVATTTIDITGGGGVGGVGLGDLAIGMNVNPDPGIVGHNLTYAITSTNHGPDPAETVTLVDTLPAGITFVSANASQGSCNGTTIVTCDLGTIANGSSASVTIRIVPTAAGTVTNTAAVAGSTLDPNPLDNQASLTTVVEGNGGTRTCTITGTEGDDVLRGTDGNDVICGLGGDDRLIGLAGKDVLDGGSGNDVIAGGRGNDTLEGSAGGDTLKGSSGRDVLEGGSGRDRFSGGAGRDRCGSRPREVKRGCE